MKVYAQNVIDVNYQSIDRQDRFDRGIMALQSSLETLTKLGDKDLGDFTNYNNELWDLFADLEESSSHFEAVWADVAEEKQHYAPQEGEEIN